MKNILIPLLLIGSIMGQIQADDEAAKGLFGGAIGGAALGGILGGGRGAGIGAAVGAGVGLSAGVAAQKSKERRYYNDDQGNEYYVRRGSRYYTNQPNQTQEYQSPRSTRQKQVAQEVRDADQD